MHILITGGTGFIGFHLAKVLLAGGDKVVGTDNHNDYYDPQLKRDRFAQPESSMIINMDDRFFATKNYDLFSHC